MPAVAAKALPLFRLKPKAKAMPSSSFHAFVKELFAGVGAVQIKRMFGGAGGYAEGVMFLLIADDTIYLKVDDPLRAELLREGSAAFTWTPSKGPHAGEQREMGYWRLPEDALDDPDLAAQWGRKALVVAQRAAKAKPAKKTKTKKA